jgi:hypothetical protein
MRPSRQHVALTILVLLAAACASEKPIISTPVPAPQPIVDSAPYLCKLVPEQAFRLVSGATGPLVERIDGTEENGDCRAPDAHPRPLQVWWMREGSGMPREHLDFLMEDRRQIYAKHGGVALPKDLGDGLVAYLPNSPFADEPYRASAKFRCGGKERLIDIYLARIAKGRDAMKDLTELMYIAQKRYGKLYNCKPNK